jgi:hypothetical protein
MDRKVLIIGDGYDPHVREVCAHLARMGVPYFVFEIPEDRIDLSVRGRDIYGGIRSPRRGEKIDFGDVRSVWNRFKHSRDFSSDDPAVRSEAGFAWTEWTDIRASLPYYVAPERWVNHVSWELAISRKARQYVVATKVGLRIPDTSVTNDPDSVRRLFARHRRLIYKPNEMPALTHNRLIFATEIDEGITDTFGEEIAVAPGIYQELIEQEHELRVMVIGEALLAVRIFSEFGRTGAIDRRRVPEARQRFEVADLDTVLSGRILEFHRRAGLVYGAYDIIVSRSGEPVFLEVNPRGNWMPLEERLKLPIAERMALQLAGSCGWPTLPPDRIGNHP